MKHARSRGRELEPAVVVAPYRGDAQHDRIAMRDYQWHKAQGRRFYTADGYELGSFHVVEIAIAEGEEVWSR